MLNSRPESDEKAEEEAAAEDVDGDVVCILLVLKDQLCEEDQEHELTEPELGGTTFPEELTVQPLGSPEIDDEALLTEVTTVAVAEPDQGNVLVVVAVPPFPNPRAPLPEFEEVTAGAELEVVEAEAGVSVPSELIWPPVDWIDSHVPLVPE